MGSLAIIFVFKEASSIITLSSLIELCDYQNSFCPFFLSASNGGMWRQKAEFSVAPFNYYYRGKFN